MEKPLCQREEVVLYSGPEPSIAENHTGIRSQVNYVTCEFSQCSKRAKLPSGDASLLAQTPSWRSFHF